jgi:hypothetical protein
MSSKSTPSALGKRQRQRARPARETKLDKDIQLSLQTNGYWQQRSRELLRKVANFEIGFMSLADELIRFGFTCNMIAGLSLTRGQLMIDGLQAYSTRVSEHKRALLEAADEYDKRMKSAPYFRNFITDSGYFEIANEVIEAVASVESDDGAALRAIAERQAQQTGDSILGQLAAQRASIKRAGRRVDPLLLTMDERIAQLAGQHAAQLGTIDYKRIGIEYRNELQSKVDNRLATNDDRERLKRLSQDETGKLRDIESLTEFIRKRHKASVDFPHK